MKNDMIIERNYKKMNDINKLVMARNGQIHEYEIIYYWYHHMCLHGKTELIHQAIEDGDYEEFMRYYHPLGNSFFPQTASVFSNHEIIGEIAVDNPEGFALITYNECECG